MHSQSFTSAHKTTIAQQSAAGSNVLIEDIVLTKEQNRGKNGASYLKGINFREF